MIGLTTDHWDVAILGWITPLLNPLDIFLTEYRDTRYGAAKPISFRKAHTNFVLLLCHQLIGFIGQEPLDVIIYIISWAPPHLTCWTLWTIVACIRQVKSSSGSSGEPSLSTKPVQDYPVSGSSIYPRVILVLLTTCTLCFMFHIFAILPDFRIGLLN